MYLAIAGGILLLAATIGPFFLVLLDLLLGSNRPRRPVVFEVNLATFFAIPLGVLGLAAIRYGLTVSTRPVRAGITMLIGGGLALLFTGFGAAYWISGLLLAAGGILALTNGADIAPPYPRSTPPPNYPVYNYPSYTPSPAGQISIRSEDLPVFYQAVGQAQAGIKSAAYPHFKSLEIRYPTNIDILLWVAFTAPTLAEAEYQISRAVMLAPGMSSVVQAQQWLADEKAKGRF